MTDKRYFKRMWEEEYYIFDSNTISESDFEEKLEYQGYKAFEDSMMGDEVVNRLNALHETNRKQSEIIDWLIGALRDDDKIFNEKGISYIINNTLYDLINGKISVDELLEEWDND